MQSRLNFRDRFNLNRNQLIPSEMFYKVFSNHNVEIHEKSKNYIHKRFVKKGSDLIPFKEVLSRLTWDLSKERPLESPWIIRSSKMIRKIGDGNDLLSIASSYLQTSVLSANSKRLNIDKIIEEHSQIIDRVK